MTQSHATRPQVVDEQQYAECTLKVLSESFQPQFNNNESSSIPHCIKISMEIVNELINKRVFDQNDIVNASNEVSYNSNSQTLTVKVKQYTIQFKLDSYNVNQDWVLELELSIIFVQNLTSLLSYVVTILWNCDESEYLEFGLQADINNPKSEKINKLIEDARKHIGTLFNIISKGLKPYDSNTKVNRNNRHPRQIIPTQQNFHVTIKTQGLPPNSNGKGQRAPPHGDVKNGSRDPPFDDVDGSRGPGGFHGPDGRTLPGTSGRHGAPGADVREPSGPSGWNGITPPKKNIISFDPSQPNPTNLFNIQRLPTHFQGNNTLPYDQKFADKFNPFKQSNNAKKTYKPNKMENNGDLGPPSDRPEFETNLNKQSGGNKKQTPNINDLYIKNKEFKDYFDIYQVCKMQLFESPKMMEVLSLTPDEFTKNLYSWARKPSDSVNIRSMIKKVYFMDVSTLYEQISKDQSLSSFNEKHVNEIKILILRDTAFITGIENSQNKYMLRYSLYDYFINLLMINNGGNVTDINNHFFKDAQFFRTNYESIMDSFIWLTETMQLTVFYKPEDISVFVTFRGGTNTLSKKLDPSISLHSINPNTVVNLNDRENNIQYEFGPFTRVYINKSNSDYTRSLDNMIRGDSKHILKNINEGVPVFIMGYGASGSGKTSSLIYLRGTETTQGSDGIIVKLISQTTFKEMTVTFKEFYADDDLLYQEQQSNALYTAKKIDGAQTGLTMYQTRNVNFKFIRNSTNVFVLDSEYDIAMITHEPSKRVEPKTFDAGQPLGQVLVDMVDDKNVRRIAATSNNPSSSRSHVLITFTFEKDKKKSYVFIGDYAGVENKFPCDVDINELISMCNQKIYQDKKMIDIDLRRFDKGICKLKGELKYYPKYEGFIEKYKDYKLLDKVDHCLDYGKEQHERQLEVHKSITKYYQDQDAFRYGTYTHLELYYSVMSKRSNIVDFDKLNLITLKNIYKHDTYLLLHILHPNLIFDNVKTYKGLINELNAFIQKTQYPDPDELLLAFVEYKQNKSPYTMAEIFKERTYKGAHDRFRQVNKFMMDAMSKYGITRGLVYHLGYITTISDRNVATTSTDFNYVVLGTVRPLIKNLNQKKDKQKETAFEHNHISFIRIRLFYLLKTILQIYFMYKSCSCRLMEGNQINLTLNSFRDTMKTIMDFKYKEKLRRFPGLTDNCKLQLCPVLHKNDCIAHSGENVNITASSITHDILREHVLDIINPSNYEEAVKQLKIVVYGVFNNTNAEDSKHRPYVNTSELKYEINRFANRRRTNEIRSQFYIHKVHSYQLGINFKKFNVQILKSVIDRLEKFAPIHDKQTNAWVIKGIPKAEYDQIHSLLHNQYLILAEDALDLPNNFLNDLNNAINLIQKINDTTPIGTLEFLDHIAKGNQFNDRICVKSENFYLPVFKTSLL